MRVRSRNVAVFFPALLALQCAPAASAPHGPPHDASKAPHDASHDASKEAPHDVPGDAPSEVPWARHQAMGRCFPSARAFIEAVAGPEGPADENMKARPAAPLAGSTWVIDATAQTNHTWYLLQPGQGASSCLTLHVPAASEIALAEKGAEQTADSKTQASPDFPEKHVHFVRPEGQPTFHPETCEEVFPETGARKIVPCAKLFD